MASRGLAWLRPRGVGRLAGRRRLAGCRTGVACHRLKTPLGWWLGRHRCGRVAWLTGGCSVACLASVARLLRICLCWLCCWY